MENKQTFVTIVLSVITITYLQSCGLLGISLPVICDRFEFTIPFTVEIEGDRDTIAVGDTFKISHEMPFRLKENKNGTYYDIGPIGYDPDLYMLKVFDKNSIITSDPSSFEFIKEPDSGEILFQTLSNGYTLKHVVLQQDSTRYFFKSKVVAKSKGEYLVYFRYLDSDLRDIDFVQDTCQTQGIEFSYELNQGVNYTKYKLGTDSIWLDNGQSELNIFALHDRYDFFYLTVVE